MVSDIRFGYITFDTIDAAARAIDGMHTQIFEGRRVVVQYSSTDFRANLGAKPPSKTLYVGNLSFDMSDRELNDLFKDIRNVIDVRVAIDRKTGLPRGFAHADFIDIASAQVAYEQLSNKAPHGRRLRVDFSQTKVGRRSERQSQSPSEPEY
jgi:RNA recognition motif-containing protein